MGRRVRMTGRAKDKARQTPVPEGEAKVRVVGCVANAVAGVKQSPLVKAQQVLLFHAMCIHGFPLM